VPDSVAVVPERVAVVADRVEVVSNRPSAERRARLLTWVGRAFADRREVAAYAVLLALVLVVGLGLGWRSVERHLALQSNAEDLGFTDQIIWNFLRGQVFRFSTYQNAEFETDIDLRAIRRPDSLLAFHVEPILVALVPLYAVVPDVRAILWLQGIALALGAIPAYRLARRRLGHPLAGLAFAAVFLLMPPVQWAALADFHTVALAAPLLLLAIDALDAGRWRLFLAAGLLAAGTKEEVGLIVAGLGGLGLLRTATMPTWLPRPRWLPRRLMHLRAFGLGPPLGRYDEGCISSRDAWKSPRDAGDDQMESSKPRCHPEAGGACRRACPERSEGILSPAQPVSSTHIRALRNASLAAVVLGVGWSVLCVGVIIPSYSGGEISPFTARYAHLGGSPGALARTLFEQPLAYVETLGRPEVLGYVGTLLLGGGWLALFAPELLLPVAPVLALNVLSNSPWMAAGRAHYSASLVPLLVVAAIFGAERMARLSGRFGGRRAADCTVGVLSLAAVLAGVVGYRQAGIGPFVEGLPAPVITRHAELGRQLAATIPAHASVSASSALYPHLSQRAGAFMFPTLNDAEYVLVDVAGSAYPSGPGGIHRRLRELLSNGEYRLLAAEDGFVMLKRGPAGEQPLPDRFFDFARMDDAPTGPPLASFHDGAVEFVSERLVPTGEVGPRGPLATLETAWRVTRPVPERPRPSMTVRFRDGTRQLFDNEPVLWWYPPERWRPGELIRLNVEGLSAREVVGWEADAPLDPAPTEVRTSPQEEIETGSEGQASVPASVAGEPQPVGSGQSADGVRSVVSAPPSAGAAATDAESIRAPVPTGPSSATTPPSSVTDAAGADPDTAGPAKPPTDADTIAVTLGELTVRVEREPLRVTVLDARERVIWQAAGSDDGAVGPFELTDRSGTRSSLTRVREFTRLDDGVRLVVETDAPDGRTATLELRGVGGRAVRIGIAPSDADAVTRVGGAVVAEPDERFLGFGERFDGVDQRGRVVRTWAEDRRDVRFGAATYAPIPWFISSRGYGMLVESDARSTFDVASAQADRLLWQIERPSVSLLVAAGAGPREILQDLVRLDGVGRPPLPPIWAFGVWKTAVGGSAQVLRDAARIRSERLPVSGLLVYDVTDDRSLLGWGAVEYGGRSTGPYANPRDLTDRLHALGFKVLGYKNPDVPHGSDVPAELLVRDRAGNSYLHPHHRVGWVDFTNQAAVEWWGGLWRRILGQSGGELGFDGAMLDLGELVPVDARYADGTDGIETHNRYLGLYARASFEAARAVRGDDAVLFARSASLGARPFQSLQWPGDQTISWDQEGIRGVLPAALSLGLSGFPYWHPEVGGYAGVGLPRRSERELWLRWLQLGALSPLLRDNYGDHQGEPVEVWSDKETIEAFRRYAGLHTSLVPYLYTQARIASETGLPIVRHLAFAAPDDPRAWGVEDTYTLGDDLLVAPVLEEGARLRTVFLPAGAWVDWWTGRAWEGGQIVTVEAPLDRIPLFVRSGTILPLAREDASLVHSEARDAQPVAGDARAWTGDLIVQVVAPSGAAPPPEARQQLYDGTAFSTRIDAGRLALTVEGAPVERTYQVRLPVASPPASVSVNGQPTDGWRHEDGTVVLDLRAADFEVVVEP